MERTRNNEAGYVEAFATWKESFSRIHGTLDTQRRLPVSKIQADYGVRVESKEELFAFVFALENYYALILHIFACKRLNGSTVPAGASVLNPAFFLKKGIANYDCDDIYKVYQADASCLHVLNLVIKEARSWATVTGDYDVIKKIFEALFPREVRHSMGEFYTPDWLAEYVVEQITAKDKIPHVRTYLDPTCGSGTFICCVVAKFVKENAEVLKNVYGMDINPLAVLAAKTNYLLACSDEFLEREKPVIIPIFTVDIADPTRYAPGLSGYDYSVCGQQITLPRRAYCYKEYRALLLASVGCQGGSLPADLASVAAQLEGADVSAVRRFMSQFAGLCLPQVDYVVGNPPWVNWEYLPADYKERTAHVWQYYELFDYKGMNSIFVKEDIAALVTYAAADKFLKQRGQLGFVIKETLFKSSKHGAGFRKFHLAPGNVDLNPFRVDDLTEFKPFPEVNNRTAILFLRKGEKVQYPTAYVRWLPHKKKTFNPYCSLSDVKHEFSFAELQASPVARNDPTSGWLTLGAGVVAQRYLGESAYKARTGVFSGGANGLFWVEVLGKSNGHIIVANLVEKARIKFRRVEAALEPEHVYPLMVGSELEAWATRYSRYIICPHTVASKMYPVDEEELEKTPKLLAYFNRFKKELEARKGFTSFDKAIHEKYFYALQRIGEYTFAPYKVAWRYICKRFTVAVIEAADDKILGRTPIIPNEKIIYVGLGNRDEAYYLCGVLSSTPVRDIVESYTVSIQVGPGTIEKLNIARFEADNELHMAISRACRKGHEASCKEKYMRDVDGLVSELYAKY